MAARKNPSNGTSLNREVYATARAQGKSKAEAARMAGSRAKSVQTLAKQGIRLEAEEGMAQRIAIAREYVILGIEDHWDKAVARMAQLLDHPDWRARTKSADFFAKVSGGYAPTKIEHSGEIETDAVGALANLTADGRRELRAILTREVRKKKQ